jgi:hypothetical protein
MRSTNIVIFLVLLNASAVFIGASGLGGDLGYTPTIGGDDQISDAEDAARDVSASRSALDNFIAGIIAAAETMGTIFGIVIAGPQMFINLGVPGPLVAFVAAPLYILVGIDVLQIISGRDIA